MTQGKVERYHRTMKNYYAPGELSEELGCSIEYYNHQGVHESLGNLTPADVYQAGRSRRPDSD